MKKTAFCLAIILLLQITFTASADVFTIRDGIKWYMTEDQVIQRLKNEADFSTYTLYHTEDFDLDKIYTIFPYEKEHHQTWLLGLTNISLGSTNESVQLILCGTKKTGLYTLYYIITPNDSAEKNYYSRAKELTAQLEKKYGKFKVTDKWASRNSINNAKVYGSWLVLFDGTEIWLHINKQNTQYELYLEYQSPQRKEIEQSLIDGSYYIEPSFGL